MHSDYGEHNSSARLAARFLLEYYNIWDKYFPGLNKRAHWHVIFLARTSGDAGISSRAIHRTLYGSYGTDIRTCIERIKDCDRDGFIKVFDASNRACVPSATCLIGPTGALRASFDAHCREALAAISAVSGDDGQPRAVRCDEAAIGEIYRFFGACDQKWRETSEEVVRGRGLTPAHRDDAMDHLVTYQYWAIVMLLWSASPFGSDHGPAALIVDEIISRMWDRLQLGHLAIKERVGNLIRWGFFLEETIRKHKAVSLTPQAGVAMSRGLAEVVTLLADLRERLVPGDGATISARIA